MHKTKAYPGMHDAIVDAELFARAQETLQANRVTRRRRGAAQSLLAGLLFDAAGRRMSPSHAVKEGRRYRYYVSQGLLRSGGPDAAGERLPAQELEAVVERAVLELLGDAPRLRDAVRSVCSPSDLPGFVAGARGLVEAWPRWTSSAQHEALRELLREAVWRGDALETALSRKSLVDLVSRRPAPVDASDDGLDA